MARWHADLQEYDYKIKHIPGNTNILADALSSGKMSVAYMTIHDHKRSVPGLKGVPFPGSQYMII
jgi:hypothetical protein